MTNSGVCEKRTPLLLEIKYASQQVLLGRHCLKCCFGKEAGGLRDRFGRGIDYLRISITDRCNLRCRYCMPAEGVKKREHRDILSLEEITEIAQEAVALGVRKIRVTGGEPLVRQGVCSLCQKLSAIDGLEDLALTTNGLLLPVLAQELKTAGVGRVNISLDTLDPVKYRYITRGGTLENALAGIRAAWDAELRPVKINTVLAGGFNDDEILALAELTRELPIEVRFIELMPMTGTDVFGPQAYLPCCVVLERLPLLEREEDSGVARRFRLPGAAGTIGLISPLSCGFCGSCNRLRLTADGFLKPCLHSRAEIPVRGLHGAALRKKIREAILQKPAQHGALSPTERSDAGRDMNQIGG